jgi:outer membrane lipoprotein-sorting protein
MKKLNKIMVMICLVAISFHGIAQTGPEILTKLDQVMFSAKDMTATNKMILTDKSGKQEVRESSIIQKGTEMRLIRFISPASQAGISMLSLPNDVIYLYMPAFGKERRISSSVKSQKFAGTDFSYEDLQAQPYSNQYTAKLISTTATTYVLELTPKKAGEYSKIVVTINKTDYYPITTEFYDKTEIKVKESKYTFNKIGKYWCPQEIEMSDLKKGTKTKIQMVNPKYDTGINDDEFTVRKLIK